MSVEDFYARTILILEMSCNAACFASLQSLTPCKVITINKTAQIFSLSHIKNNQLLERERSTRAESERNAAERTRMHRKTIAIFHRQKSFAWMRKTFSHIYLARNFPDTAALSH